MRREGALVHKIAPYESLERARGLVRGERVEQSRLDVLGKALVERRHGGDNIAQLPREVRLVFWRRRRQGRREPPLDLSFRGVVQGSVVHLDLPSQ